MPRRTSYRSGVPCWIDCLSAAPAASEDFYGELFGWGFDRGDGYRFIRMGGEIIGGLGILEPGRVAVWTTYLASKDLTATTAAVRALGGRVVMPPTPAGRDGAVCLTLDTSGAVIGFFCGAHTDGVVLVDEPGALVRHQLHTPCLTTSSTFYGGLVDGTIDIGRDGARLVIDGRSHADLVLLDGVRAGAALWVPIFGVEDLTDATTRAADCGGGILPPAGPAATTDVLVRDPGGAVFGMTEFSSAA